jgi:two-component system, NtrC family, response regulator PilR
MQTKAKVPGRILVIDDEVSVRQLLERVLTRAGHHVELAEDGENALAKIAKEKYDLLVIDKNLPGLGGLEILKLVRAQFPSLLAIMITGFPTPESEATGKDLGLHSYIVKPFGIVDIVRAVDEAIAASRAAAGATPTK